MFPLLDDGGGFQRRETEGEIRQSTLDREHYHLRETLKFAKHGP